MKKIALICQAGISTRILKKSMKKEIEIKNYDISIEAISTYEIKEIINEDNFDMLLFTPQLKLIYESYLEEYGNQYEIKLVDMEDFNNLNVKNILESINNSN